MASGNDTYEGALEVLAKQLATMAGLADANLPFVVNLLEQVTQERRSPELAMQRAGVLPSPPGNPMGADALGLGGGPGGLPMGPGTGMPGGMSAPPPSLMGAGVPGAGPSTAPPPMNPDEMRRVLTAGAQ